MHVDTPLGTLRTTNLLTLFRIKTMNPTHGLACITFTKQLRPDHIRRNSPIEGLSAGSPKRR